MRNIGIVGDGPTDLDIFSKFIQSVLMNGTSNEESFNICKLRRQKLRDYIDIYWRAATKIGNYYLPSAPAAELQNNITATLTAAFADFESEVGIGELSNRDILLITTDAEKSLSSAEAYFQDWSFSISKILLAAIDKFYALKSKEGYLCEYLPVIVSLVCFPFSEVLVAAAKEPFIPYYGKKPADLKQLLYGTTNLQELRFEDFEAKALNYITPESISRIFSYVPESRILI
ncbi:MAG: hypothetical protein HC849_02475 [Oscillatoriales cyanobacterium RU_3_3]|nr:hypothetical protein [Oscillatoriales cyanobacterium RU_3_3]NJR25372.1 hypothetical protein [Richelia sp. CSU_2_1]